MSCVFITSLEVPPGCNRKHNILLREQQCHLQGRVGEGGGGLNIIMINNICFFIYRGSDNLFAISESNYFVLHDSGLDNFCSDKTSTHSSIRD